MMKSYLKRKWFLGSLLQVMPLLLYAQEDMILRSPKIPDPIPPAPRLVIHQSPGVPPGAFLPSVHPSAVASPLTVGPPMVDDQQLEGLKGSDESNPVENILSFWFGFLPRPEFFPEEKIPIWFASTPEFDRQILSVFGQEVIRAQRGEYNSWRSTPRGRLALVLLLDQIPRHIYRNRSQVFTLDRMARALVLEGIQKGDDKHLYPIERAFFYLPLEHAEDLELQNLSVASYRQLLVESPEQLKPQMHEFLQAALMHQQQIARFGRFPHRNAVLGRESTPEEMVFLMQWRDRK